MDRISKDACLMLCDLLALYGVRKAVLSPGSRNAPLIVAMERSGNFDTHIVIDEREAGFVALGMSLASREAVALVCTSGSALLNYAPAVAEACYRRIPLVVISADRPAEWIDQDDSQTIRQPDALANFVRASVDVSESAYAGVDGPWWLNRRLNDTLSAATGRIKGPVHINMQLAEPLTAMTNENTPRVFGTKIDVAVPVGGSLPDALVDTYRNSRKVLVVVGFMEPDPHFGSIVNRLADMGCAVLKEAQSNIDIRSEFVIGTIDATLREIRGCEDEYLPDLVITMGGALLSRHVKAFLRRHAGRMTIWSVGYHDRAVDCFRGLDTRVEMNPCDFVDAILSLDAPKPLSYAQTWRQAALASQRTSSFAEAAPWSDFKAVYNLIEASPRIHLQVSNGTAIRYVQLFSGYGRFASIHCNRGVSGIDGCTSTAIGFSSVRKRPTLFLTGDMSAAYDIGALALPMITPRFKMAVLNNRGGGIFRFIPSTRDLPELERCFAASPRLPLAELARAYGFRYFEATDERSFKNLLPDFFAEAERPALFNIITPAEISAKILTEYFQ